MQPLRSVPERSPAGARFIAPAVDRESRIIVAGLLVAAVMVALLAASQLINFGVFDLRFHVFDSDYHTSVFGLASLAAQLAVAGASGWRGSQVQRHRSAWFALGALIAVLGLVREVTTFNATALAVPLVCVFALICWLTWRDPGAVRLIVWTGLVLMVTSLLLHKVGIASDASTASDYTWPYQIVTVVKHGCELAGWTLVATGILAGTDRVRRRTSPAPESLVREIESVAP